MSRQTEIKRTFIEGWISQADPQLAALIWQLLDTSTGTLAFEAEVIWSDEHIDTLSASQLDVLKRMLDQMYEGSEKDWASDPGYSTPPL